MLSKRSKVMGMGMNKSSNIYIKEEMSINNKNVTSTESNVDMLDIESDSKTGKGINIEFVTESSLSESDKSNRKHVEKISVNHMNIKKLE